MKFLSSRSGNGYPVQVDYYESPALVMVSVIPDEAGKVVVPSGWIHYFRLFPGMTKDAFNAKYVNNALAFLGGTLFDKSAAGGARRRRHSRKSKKASRRTRRR